MMPFWLFLPPMNRNSTINQNGFTYLLALVIIMIMGIMLGAVGQSWRTIVQRDREEELLFRGTQIKDAITRWYTPRGTQHAATPLRDLKDLLQDPRSLTTIRYLRRLYTDPMTGKEWMLISDPNKGILGVASTSALKPFKVGGFPDDLKELSDKNQYSEWRFVYTAPVAPGAGGVRPGVQPPGQPLNQPNVPGK